MVESKQHHILSHRGNTIGTPLKGTALLNCAILNKANAFSADERIEFALDGLLPPDIETLDEQVMRAYDEYQQKDTDLERHIFLRALQDHNELLLYRLLTDHIIEMMPIIYTPVVGEACQKFSEIYRKPRGLFIAYPHKDRIPELLANIPFPEIDVIVVTDGERILGLGDQGAGGMGIPIGKLSLYTLVGGIDPAKVLPVILDVGTNNKERLDDPMYIGWRHERITGDDYYEFVDGFVNAVKDVLPDVLLQFEDFAQTHAKPLLDKYRDQLCTFNDDIQGTAAVTLGALLAAVKVARSSLDAQRIVVLGGGSAGTGICEQLVQAMIEDGMSEAEARSRFWIVDRNGLIRDDQNDLLSFQKPFVRAVAELADWSNHDDDAFGLANTIKMVQPTVLIGVSGQPGLFSKELICEMAAHTSRPIIFPLSNPTSRVEATPADLLSWTEGRALVATGSPFDDVELDGKHYPIAQCNNAYIFPAMGLAICASGARRVSDGMFMAASYALSEQSPALTGEGDGLLPTLDLVQNVSKKVALAVALQAQKEGLAPQKTEAENVRSIDEAFWHPIYSPLVATS